MKEEKQEIAVNRSGSGGSKEVQKYGSPFEEMERMFNDFFQQRFFAPSWMPRFKFPELASHAP